MEQEQKQNPGPSFREILVFAIVVAVIGMMLLIHAHFATFKKWIEISFWAILGVIAIFFMIVVLLIKVPNIPTNMTELYLWLKERAVNRVRKGRDDKKLSVWEKEHIQKIENHYQDKIDKLYD